MCTDVRLSIESKSIIRGKNFNHPTKGYQENNTVLSDHEITLLWFHHTETRSGQWSVHPGLMCTDVHLSIESKSIIRGKNFNHPTLYTTTHQIIAHSIIHNNLNSKQNETSDKCLEWNHGNGFHTRHLFSHHCFICFPNGCSFHFQTHHQTGCSTAYLEERFSDTFRLSPVLCIHRLLELISNQSTCT